MELLPAYAVIDLLAEVGRCLAARQIRKISVEFHSELSYDLEIMDARTNRIRYQYVEQGKPDIQAYFSPTDIETAIVEMTQDVRRYHAKIMSGGSSDHPAIKVLLFIPGQKDPIVFETEPGSLRFVRK